MDLARTHGDALEQGRILYDYGKMLAHQGDREGARKRLGDTLRLFRETGAHAYADRTERAITNLLAR